MLLCIVSYIFIVDLKKEDMQIETYYKFKMD